MNSFLLLCDVFFVHFLEEIEDTKRKLSKLPDIYPLLKEKMLTNHGSYK